jgi:predicted AAA+ superfamily ATPase
MLKRTLEKIICEVSNTFPVLLLTGPRQIGKTTLLENCKEQNRSYVTLDDLEQRQLAKTDPALFLQENKSPLIIDEVQYAPELFSYIKIHVDKNKKNGDFWLTGSQKFHLMKGITESLAGRVAIIDMLGLSNKEIENNADGSIQFMDMDDWLENARKNAGKPMQSNDLYKRIWLGSYPRLISDKKISRDYFYKSYLQTYIERDVKDILNVGNELAFYNFIRATAARTGQLLNYAELARDVDIDTKTAKSWLSVLETSGLIKLLEPYYYNITKRIIKTPKLYFLDTGLCSFLTGWNTAKTLESGAMNGAILETYVFSEILKSYWHNGKYPNIYFYRDADQREIDFVIERDGMLYPIEIKKTATPSLTAIKNFFVLENLKKKVGMGSVICLREKDISLSRGVVAVPVWYI